MSGRAREATPFVLVTVHREYGHRSQFPAPREAAPGQF